LISGRNSGLSRSLSFNIKVEEEEEEEEEVEGLCYNIKVQRLERCNYFVQYKYYQHIDIFIG